MNKKFFLNLLLMLIVAPICFAAETFRISSMQVIDIVKDADFEYSIKLGLNDSLKINLPENMNYIDGLELKFEIPEELVMEKSVCEFLLYDNLTPDPSQNHIDYSGTKIFRNVVPSRLTWNLQIPFSQSQNYKSNQYTTKIGQIPDLSKHYLFLKFNQLKKNVSAEVAEAEITITVKPVLSDKGQLFLNLLCPDENSDTCTVYINDYAYHINSLKNGIYLPSGIYTISVISEYYRTEVRKIRVEQTKITDLQIQMRSIEPTLIITAPSKFKIYLDGDLCNTIGREFEISEGDHIIKFSLGDYEVIRTINVVKGKTYKANISIDFMILEE